MALSGVPRSCDAIPHNTHKPMRHAISFALIWPSILEYSQPIANPLNAEQHRLMEVISSYIYIYIFDTCPTRWQVAGGMRVLAIASKIKMYIGEGRPHYIIFSIYFHGSFHELLWKFLWKKMYFYGSKLTSMEKSMEVGGSGFTSMQISMQVGGSKFTSMGVSGSFHGNTRKFPLSVEVDASIAFFNYYSFQ